MALSRTDYSIQSSKARGNSTAAFTTTAYALPANAIVTVAIASVIFDNAQGGWTPANIACTSSAAGTGTRRVSSNAPVVYQHGHTVFTFATTSAVSSTFTVSYPTLGVNDFFVMVTAFTGADGTTPIAAATAGTNPTNPFGSATMTLSASPVAADVVMAWLDSTQETGTPTVTAGTSWTRLFFDNEDDWQYTACETITGVTSSTVSWASIGTNGISDEVRLTALIVKAAAGGTTYNLSIAETATGADAPAGAMTTPQAVTESSASADSPSAGGSGPVSVAESSAATDAPSGIASMGVALSESSASVDAPAGALVTAQAVAESTSSADAPATGGVPAVPVLRQYWLKNWQTGTPATLQSPYNTNPFTPGAGTTLVALTAGWDGTRQIPVPTASPSGTFAIPSDGTTSAVLHPDSITVDFSCQANASAVSTTIAVPTINDGAGGTNGELGVWLIEIPGMPSTLQVREVAAAHNNSSTKTWSLSTKPSGSTIQVGDICLTVGTYENSAGSVSGGLSNPAGWQQIFTNNDATNFIPTQFSWKTVTVAGQQSVSFTTTDNAKTEDFAIILVLVPSPNGSTYAVSDAESVTAVDAPAGLLVAPEAVGESSGTADAPSASNSTVQAAAEAIASADAQTAALITQQTVSEVMAGADAVSAAQVLAVLVAEATAAAETVSGLAVLGISLTEALTAADVVSPGGIVPAGILESVGAVDAVQAVALISTLISDALAATDATGSSSLIVAQALETMSPIDVLAATQVLALALAELAQPLDTVTPGSATTVAIGEDVVTIDAATWEAVAYSLLRAFTFPSYPRDFTFPASPNSSTFPE